MSRINKCTIRQTQQGAVSLIIVIFTALLMTIITIGFVTLMTQDQQQASNSDLSQSAYDSAQAGVEDAKRLLIANQACLVNVSSSAGCSSIMNALNTVGADGATGCTTLSDAGIVGQTNNETLIQKNASTGNALDQAYTCVKVKVNTPDYLGQLTEAESVVVPLRSASPFDSVRLSWFSKNDLPPGSNGSVQLPTAGDTSLPKLSNWASSRPPLMRTEIIQTAGSFTLDDLTKNSNGTNVNTLFLYPSGTGAQSLSTALDVRQAPPKAPQPAKCSPSLSSGGYACSVVITLGRTHNTNDSDAYLNLVSLYNQSHFKVELMSGSTVVPFKNVQPEVDSTGRANNLFRRVVSRVELLGNVIYPNAALDVSGNLCKNFSVTDSASDYSVSSCRP